MDRNGQYSNFGPLTEQLIERYSEMLHVSTSQIVTVANATLGLEGAIRQSPQVKWLVPAYTFPASGHAVLNAGREIVFNDVNSNDWTSAPSAGFESIGYLAVAPFGAWPDLTDLDRTPELILDAAASLGSLPDLSSLPSTWAVVFSMHATKVLPAGEGALVVFGSTARAEAFRSWTNFGFDGNRESKIQATNGKMSEIHAAYALTSLDDWEKEKEDWQRSRQVAQEVKFPSWISEPAWQNDLISPYWIAHCESRRLRKRLELALARNSIESRRWWGYLPGMEAFSHYPKMGLLTGAAQLADEIIGLPFFRGLNRTHAALISDTMNALDAADD